jgi:hypothetical protein
VEAAKTQNKKAAAEYIALIAKADEKVLIKQRWKNRKSIFY